MIDLGWFVCCKSLTKLRMSGGDTGGGGGYLLTYLLTSDRIEKVIVVVRDLDLLSNFRP